MAFPIQSDTNMSLIKKLSNRILGINKDPKAAEVARKAMLRRCRFEVMEERRVLSADPVVAGVTFVEGDDGQDTAPDFFEVSFTGGADTTQLTQFSISGDQDFSGDLSDGDAFFHVNQDQLGASGSSEFEFDAANSQGITESDILGVSISDDGLELIVDVQNFEEGDILAFTIDVDEVESVRFDEITSGVEFEGSLFQTQFVDENFSFEDLDIQVEVDIEDTFIPTSQTQTSGVFFDEFNDLLAEGENVGQGNIDVPRDNDNDQEDRSAGTVDAFELIPLPIELHGTVFHDENIDCVHDGTEEGISGVTIELQQLNETTGEFDTVATTETDAAGNYWFGSELGLPPGTYRVVEIQPEGFLDVGALSGELDGESVGTVGTDANGDENIIDQIVIPLGGTTVTGLDFKDVRPASVHGTVFVDNNDNGVQDPGEQGIENVLIELFDGDGNLVDSVLTNDVGDYWFENLFPGEYHVEQTQPTAFIDGQDALGQINGFDGGTRTDGSVSNDAFWLELEAGDEGVNFDFGELEPAALHGTVFIDNNDSGSQDTGELGIENVLIELFDGDGNLVDSTFTDANGDYWFTDLAPGEYHIEQTQPTDFIDGQEDLGQITRNTGLTLTDQGSTTNDAFWVVLESGDVGTEYDFGELQPASIHGTVFIDNNDNGTQDAGEEGIEGVLIELFDGDGNLVDSLQTDSNGDYWFEGLLPGEYHVEQTQPTSFFDGQEELGQVDRADGTTGPAGSVSSDAFWVNLEGGDVGTEYNFGELLPAEIHGRVFIDGPAFETVDGELPENFRDLRDGIFQAETDTPIEGVTLQLFRFVDPDTGQLEPRAVTLGEVQSEFYTELGSTDPNTELFALTDENGEYWFQGLPPGSYIVVEVQPEGLFDSNDSAGPTTNGSSGFTFNTEDSVETAIAPLTQTFSDTQLLDTVNNIVVNPGGVSIQNNFSEVQVLTLPPEPVPFTGNPNPAVSTNPGSNPNPLAPNPGVTGFPGLGGSQAGINIAVGGSPRSIPFQTQAQPSVDPGDAFAWHLSIINGGQPRGLGENVGEEVGSLHQVGFISNADWSRFDMESGVWTFSTTDEDGEITATNLSHRFGMVGGIPIVGDFDGDGIDDVAVYKDGYWMIDINRNGRWDQEDLLARLGDADDLPVTGDWDGDGKDDIGIYGPIWEGDIDAISHEAGLPHPENQQTSDHKNVPPQEDLATRGARTMKLSAHGRQQADLVDHVFGPDEESLLPIAGDWTGTGIRSIGAFHDGDWKLDMNGDGEFDHRDRTVNFGQAGDRPVVGDFNGDGIEDLAVYRNGTWIIDSNGNREIDITDKTFELGGADDIPIAGDWDGDGVDEPAIYSQRGRTEFN